MTKYTVKLFQKWNPWNQIKLFYLHSWFISNAYDSVPWGYLTKLGMEGRCLVRLHSLHPRRQESCENRNHIMWHPRQCPSSSWSSGHLLSPQMELSMAYTDTFKCRKKGLCWFSKSETLQGLVAWAGINLKSKSLNTLKGSSWKQHPSMVLTYYWGLYMLSTAE